MTNNKLIEKIKKLLALAGNNPNQNEAEVAMKMANKLIKENDLSMLSLTEVENEKVGRVMEDNVKPWTKIIFSAVSELYSCKYFTTHRFDEPLHVIVGTESNRVTASLIATQLVDIIAKEGKGKGNGFRNAAAMSVAYTCEEIAKENKLTEKEVIPGTGLVPVDIHRLRKEANIGYCEKHFNLKASKGSNLRTSASGFKFGAGLSVNPRMSNRKALN